MTDGVCVSYMIPQAGIPQDVYYLGNVPARLRNETARVQRENEERARRSLLEKVPRTRFRYYCSACLIIRDENEYLEEWLRWHIGQGVEHFYIYDHGSKQPVREFLQTLDKSIADRVTVTEWKGRHADAQPDAYNDCLRRFREESRWIAFVDADEQIHVKTGQTLPEFLKGYEQYAGVMAVWVTYDANGMLRKTSGTLRERFTRVYAPDEFSRTAGKLIAQAMFTDKMYVHNGRAAKGFIIADERGNAVRDYALMPENATTDLICVDHYYTKSYEEWLNKLRRGSGHARYSRAYEDFFKFNPDMTGHRENIRYRQKYESDGEAIEEKSKKFRFVNADGSPAVYTGKHPKKRVTYSDDGNTYIVTSGRCSFCFPQKIVSEVMSAVFPNCGLRLYLPNASSFGGFAVECFEPQGEPSFTAKDILPDTDLVYSVTRDMLREEIVIKSRAAGYEYEFLYLLKGMYVSLSSDGRALDFAAEGEAYPQFSLAAPSMRDASGVRSDKVCLKAEIFASGILRITFTADKAWINAETRTFPVIIY